MLGRKKKAISESRNDDMNLKVFTVLHEKGIEKMEEAVRRSFVLKSHCANVLNALFLNGELKQ